MAGHSRGQFADTNSFVSIINSTMNAVITRAYETAPTTYQYWTSVGSNPDFKKMTRYRMAQAVRCRKLQKTVSSRQSAARMKG